jgi:hypothetical protein
MAVFGEETVKIPMQFGLDPVGIPVSEKSFNILTNLIRTEDNSLAIREDFLMLMDVAKTPRVLPVTTGIVPKNTSERDMEVFTATGSASVNTPSLLMCFDDGTTRDVNWVNYNNVPTPQITTQTIATARGIKAFCQYKDRYYASNVTDTIFRVSNFTTAGGALTITDLVAIAGVNILISFKNRIFGIFKNRIYYTDLPAIGGYPETWSSSLNFVDMPTSDLDLTIYNALVYKDRMYLFTDRGVYYFSANGAPINWSIQLVSPDYPIYHRDSVCLNKGFIFLTNQVRVFAFNGVTFKDVTGSLTGLYRLWGSTGATIVKLYPYDNGIIAESISYGIITNYTRAGSRIFYFDLVGWTELDLNSGTFITAGGTNFQGEILRAGINLQPYKSKLGSSYIAYKNSNTSHRAIYLDKNRFLGDAWNTSHVDNVRTSKKFSFSSPSPFVANKKNVRFKYWSIFGYFNDTAQKMNIGAEDMYGQISTPVPTSKFAAYSQYIKGAVLDDQGLFNAPFKHNVTSLYVFGEALTEPSSASSPSIIFEKLEAVVNSDNKDKDQMSNA